MICLSRLKMLPDYNFKIIILHKFKFVNSLYINYIIIYLKGLVQKGG